MDKMMDVKRLLKIEDQKLNNPQKQQLNIPAVSGWRLFADEKPLDGNRYYFSICNQFFKGIWSDKLKGFLLDGCDNKYISSRCDYFHACHNNVLPAGVSQVDVNAKWECCKCGWIGTHNESADKTPVVNDTWLLICPKCGNKDEFYACRERFAGLFSADLTDELT